MLEFFEPGAIFMTNQSSSETVIRRLYQITQDYNKGFEHQVIELLKMGLERFGLDIAILSKIDKKDYVVKYCVTPDDISLKAGDSFHFDETYCSITYHAQGPVSIEHMGADDKYATHPAYQAFGLESYIGVPIRLNNELFGTLNFSSPTPYPRVFNDIDIDALQLMVAWIQVELIRREQESQLVALNKKLNHLACHDSLTNILNRRGMRQLLHRDINRLCRRQGKGTLALIDIDRFKQFNDTYGHQLGDEVLIEVAKSISTSLRDYDLVARHGGEEFLLWLPDTSEQECAIVCKRIMDDINNISLTADQITVSIGACYFKFDNDKPNDLNQLIDELILDADASLYKAKNEGRDQLVSGKIALDVE